MENPIYIALSRQDALRRQMDLLANNIANASTTAYKNQRPLFLEYLEEPERRDSLSFVQDFGVLRNVAPGPIQVTSNPLDVALRDDGYFVVETLTGPRFTRNGSFQLNPDRELVDINGLPVLNENDARIVIPADAGTITITGDGQIATEIGPVARLKVVTFADEQAMLELGAGLYETDQEQQILDEPEVVQGALEGSNVQPVVETTQMIDVLRAYQSTQRLIDGEHERIRQMIRQLTRSQ